MYRTCSMARQCKKMYDKHACSKVINAISWICERQWERPLTRIIRKGAKKCRSTFHRKVVGAIAILRNQSKRLAGHDHTSFHRISHEHTTEKLCYEGLSNTVKKSLKSQRHRLRSVSKSKTHTFPFKSAQL